MTLVDFSQEVLSSLPDTTIYKVVQNLAVDLNVIKKDDGQAKVRYQNCTSRIELQEIIFSMYLFH